MKNNLKKKGKLLSIAKDCEVEVSLQEDGFKGSWFRAILEQNPTRVKGKKLRPVPPECLNEGVVFKEGSVVDAYFNNGWWTGLIVVERPDGSFLVYFDDPPDIMRFIRSQLRPHIDCRMGQKQKHGKLVEMTREISESEKEKIWVRALVITEIRSQGDDRRKFLIKICTISQNSSDEAEGKHLIVDICKIRPSPPRDLCAQYSLSDYVEVVVTHGWRKGRVTEILFENKYKVYFAATKEDAIFNYTEIRLSMEWLGGGSWIKAHEREFENNAATPIRPAQESPSNALVLESDEDDMVSDDATEIKSSRESHSNTSFLEATETETQNHELVDPVDGVELPLPQESDDIMDDVATPIIDPQEIPQGETMSKSNDKIALPKRISETGTKGVVLKRINKRSNLKLVGKVENVLGKEFKKLEDSFLAPVIKMGRRQKHMAFSRHLIYQLLVRRIDIGKKGLWFSFGEQLMRFSLREFHLATGLPCVVDKDEEEGER
uniref:Agenet domain-containing protein n=1 Tax=Brassica oleracea var. oleracea TaxID=109376 RepID=A0A0D3D2X1_BRAOL